MAGDAISGWVAATISCSASVISPKPIRRGRRGPALPFSRVTDSTTPMKISSGDSHDRSNENTTAIRLVPMSAPSITASAAAGDQAAADEGGNDQAGGGAGLHQPGHRQAGQHGLAAVAEAARQHIAQVLAKDADDAGADDVGAPHQQGDRREQVQ